MFRKASDGEACSSTASSLGDKELCHQHHGQALRNVKRPIDQMPMKDAFDAVRQGIGGKVGKSAAGIAVLPAIMLTKQRCTAWRRIMESCLEIGVVAGLGRIAA
jgi:hypothetical protein